MKFHFAEVTLYGPRGEFIKHVKAQVSDVIISRDPIEVEPHPAGWRQYEPSRVTNWSLHLMEDTKREEETHFCGDHKAHGFHRYADRYWCDGYNAQQAAAEYMVSLVVGHLQAEGVPDEMITRIRNRLIFGNSEGMEGWISEQKVTEAFVQGLVDEAQMKKLVDELLNKDEQKTEE